jgi:hypothetical protein
MYSKFRFLFVFIGLNFGLAAHSFECAEGPSQALWAVKVKDANYQWNLIGKDWFWNEIVPMGIRWNQKSFQDKVLLNLKSADKKMDPKKVADAFNSKDVVFLSSILMMEISKKATSGLGYQKGSWIYTNPAFVCKSSPLQCYSIPPSADLKPESGDSLKKHLSLFLRQFELNSLPEFCADVLANKDPLFASYEELVSRCGKEKGWVSNWKSLKALCLSVAATQISIKSAIN